MANLNGSSNKENLRRNEYQVTLVQSYFSAGYYEVILNDSVPKLKALVLNTNLYLIENTVTVGETDPGGQFAWAEERLTDAVTNQYKVRLTNIIINTILF